MPAARILGQGLCPPCTHAVLLCGKSTQNRREGTAPEERQALPDPACRACYMFRGDPASCVQARFRRVASGWTRDRRVIPRKCREWACPFRTPHAPARRDGFHIRPHPRLPPGHPERSTAESNCAAAPSQTVGSPAGFAPFRQIPRLCRALRVRLRTSSSAQDDTTVQAPSSRELSRLAVTEGVYHRQISHVHNSLHHLRWSPSLKEGGKAGDPPRLPPCTHLFYYPFISLILENRYELSCRTI